MLGVLSNPTQILYNLHQSILTQYCKVGIFRHNFIDLLLPLNTLVQAIIEYQYTKNNDQVGKHTKM